jgi:type IV secretion system protein VirD4
MYKLARLFWILSILSGLYTVMLILLIGWPQSGIAVSIIAVLVAAKRRRIFALTTHGTARWANYRDLQRAGMLNAEKGLSVGYLPGKEPGRIRSALGRLFHSGIPAKQACLELMAAFRKNNRGPLVRLSSAIHTLVVSPSGGGKGVSFILPFLLWCKDSCVVNDVKGENAKITAYIREKVFGHQVVLLDPFCQVTQTPDTLNPLDFIDKNSPTAIDECLDLGKALVIRTGDERDPHWNDSAESFIAAVIAVVVFFGKAEEGTRSLQTVRDIFSFPAKLETAIKLMIESTVAEGMLARMGGQLMHFVEKEKGSVLTTVSRHLRFLDTLSVAANTRTSSFDPGGLRSSKMTIFMILPANHMRVQSPLSRMWITTFLRAVINGGLQEKRLTHVILDEAAVLGNLEVLDDAVGLSRGFGLRLQFYFQSLGQIQNCFPKGGYQTLLSNTSQVFMGVNDVGLPGGAGTADYVSARLGEHTIVVRSGGANIGGSTQWSRGGNQSSHGGGTSWGGNDNWQPNGRKLFFPSEVVALSPRTAITFTPGVPPIITWVSRYYEDLRQQNDPKLLRRTLAAAKTFMVALILCLLCFRVAARVTQRALELQAEHQTPHLQLDQPGVPADQSVESIRRSYDETGR